MAAEKQPIFEGARAQVHSGEKRGATPQTTNSASDKSHTVNEAPKKKPPADE